MALTDAQLRTLLDLVAATRDDELDCDECLAEIARFAEVQLSGRPVSGVLEAVHHHLEICAECREEYESLLAALGTLDEAQESEREG